MPFRAWLISVTIRFGLASAKMFGVERNSKALLSLLGSTHKNISCGLDGGTYVETSAGWTGSLRSKNLIRQSSVAGRVQAWMILLQRKYMIMSSFCSGQTRSSREVCPANGLVVNSFPNSFTTVGAAAKYSSHQGVGLSGADHRSRNGWSHRCGCRRIKNDRRS